MKLLEDERARRLYGLPLMDFTAARNSLAAQLRAEGDGEGAAAVRALRKPSRAAWAVNSLVRAEPELVEALLGAGGELRQAHRQAASGRGADQLRAAADAERAAVERLMARAADAIGEAPGAAIAESMRNTLHAASSDDEARELVAGGCVVEAMRPVGLGPVPTGKRGTPAPPADRDDAPKRAQAEALKAARAEESALRRELDAAERSLERAEDAAERARETAEAAGERAKEARRRARTARTALGEAQRRVARIERDAP
jgi:hypothetical protein